MERKSLLDEKYTALIETWQCIMNITNVGTIAMATTIFVTLMKWISLCACQKFKAFLQANDAFIEKIVSHHE